MSFMVLGGGIFLGKVFLGICLSRNIFLGKCLFWGWLELSFLTDYSVILGKSSIQLSCQVLISSNVELQLLCIVVNCPLTLQFEHVLGNFAVGMYSG